MMPAKVLKKMTMQRIMVKSLLMAIGKIRVYTSLNVSMKLMTTLCG